MKQVSLIIPAYNEEKRLGGFLDSIVEYLKKNNEDIAEVIVVDDGSSDKTTAIANGYKHLIKNLKVVSLQPNVGKGGAIQAGVEVADGDYIVFMDADGATDITELPKIIKALHKSPVAVGNRWMPGAQTERHSWIRRLSSWTYRTYMKLFGLGQIDTMCGFKGYHKNTAKELFKNLLEKRWLFDTEIAYKAIKKGYLVKNFPIQWISKDGSKLSTKDLIKIAFQIWPLIRKINKQKK